MICLVPNSTYCTKSIKILTKPCFELSKTIFGNLTQLNHLNIKSRKKLFTLHYLVIFYPFALKTKENKKKRRKIR